MIREEAQELVEKELAKGPEASRGTECVVLKDRTIERSWGWVFFYESKAYLENGDSRDMLLGSLQFLVNRRTGKLSRIGGHPFSVERYIEEYESRLEIDT